MTKENKILKIEDILRNEVKEFKISDLGIIKIRDPTTRDKIDARIEASKLPFWNELITLEKDNEIQTRIVLKMIVEPKITEKEYMDGNNPILMKIINAVAIEYAKRLASNREQWRKMLKSFLEQETV